MNAFDWTPRLVPGSTALAEAHPSRDSVEIRIDEYGLWARLEGKKVSLISMSRAVPVWQLHKFMATVSQVLALGGREWALRLTEADSQERKRFLDGPVGGPDVSAHLLKKLNRYGLASVRMVLGKTPESLREDLGRDAAEELDGFLKLNKLSLEAKV